MRSWWQMRSTADAICSRIARTGRSMPDIRHITSRREIESRGLFEFARNARDDLFLASFHYDGHCGSAWFLPLFNNFVLSPWLYLPILAAAASLVLLAAARLAWMLRRGSAEPERTP